MGSFVSLRMTAKKFRMTGQYSFDFSKEKNQEVVKMSFQPIPHDVQEKVERIIVGAGMAGVTIRLALKGDIVYRSVTLTRGQEVVEGTNKDSYIAAARKACRKAIEAGWPVHDKEEAVA
jgi:hypothetical protein